MRSMVLKKMDDRGQSNIDFLFGLAVFLVTFIYAVTFIPGLFVPYQPGAIDLSSVAYRTGAILVEDPGWSVNPATQAGDTAWETYANSTLQRVGLSDDKVSPDVLSMAKINALNTPSILNYSLAREKMGLDGTVLYDINLSLVMNNTLTGKQTNLLSGFVCPNSPTNEVGSIERSVMVDTGKELYVDNGLPVTGAQQRLDVKIKNKATDMPGDVTIRLYNATSNIYIPSSLSASGGIYKGSSRLLTQYLMPPNDIYKVKKNGVDVTSSYDISGLTYGPGDIVELYFPASLTNQNYVNYVGVQVNSLIFPGAEVIYSGDPKYKLQSVCYPGTLNIEVWSNAMS